MQNTNQVIIVSNSPIPFALFGSRSNGLSLLVISENCPITVRVARPINMANELSGHLKSRLWFNPFQCHYNWAISKPLLKDSTPSSFQPGSSLQLTWIGSSDKSLRERVQKLLDLAKEDLANAIHSHNENKIANLLGTRSEIENEIADLLRTHSKMDENKIADLLGTSSEMDENKIADLLGTSSEIENKIADLLGQIILECEGFSR